VHGFGLLGKFRGRFTALAALHGLGRGWAPDEIADANLATAAGSLAHSPESRPEPAGGRFHGVLSNEQDQDDGPREPRQRAEQRGKAWDVDLRFLAETTGERLHVGGV
jgi:hypothetical protein